MNVISRAITGMTKNPLKTLLLLFIVFILGAVISGAISVQQAVQNTDTNLRRELSPIVTVEVDFEALMEHEQATGEWLETETVTLEQFSQIGSLSYVRNYDLSVGANLSSRDLEKVVSEEDMHWSDGDWEIFHLKGVHGENPVDLEEGLIGLTSGRMLTEQEATTLSYVVVISEEFAQLNNLHIGSTMTLESLVWDMPSEGLSGDQAVFDEFYGDESNIVARRAHDFEVIGIFETLAEFNSGDAWNDAAMKDEFANRFYVSNPVAMDAQIFWIEAERELNPDDEWFQQDNEDLMWAANVFVLNNSEDIPAFRTAVEDMLPEFWTVTDMGDSFADVASSMESIGSLANIILYIAAGASILILSLLITLFLRERKKEIGIYLALGEKRGKVIAQMMLEVLAVALIAIALALFAGNLLAGGISETMLRNDMMASQGGFDDMSFSVSTLEWMGFGGPSASAEEVLANYNVALDTDTILFFFAAAIGTVVIATIIPMLYILRLNPRKIMM
ncbi:MAG: ABC transporter permease [Coriobacteriia bacterium]|nr:ABC transporter permease [Coriobacteriia bacterium]